MRESWQEGSGSANGGGTGLYKSVENGDTSYSSQRPICAFPLFVHVVHR